MAGQIKPVKWDRKRDALACRGCGQEFRKNDLVYPRELTGSVTVHYRNGCAWVYDADGEEIRGGKHGPA